MEKKHVLSYLLITLFFAMLATYTNGLIYGILVTASIFSGIIAIGPIISGDLNEDDLKRFKFSKSINVIVIITIIILAITTFSTRKVIEPMSTIYNESIKYNKQYDQKTMERKGYYDKLWKTFTQKEKITNLNKDVFIQVAKIQMENRKDGQNITWKWVQENTPIPYSEFTKFYSDLSTFIETQREGYYQLETQCQTISTAHNLLIDTFPNNIYNSILKIKRINFEYGFLSDSTNSIFSTKKENIK